jgi:hypothetical protein
MNTLIPVLSLFVALLAVFVGPLVTWRTTRLKLEADRRSAWANEVRQKLAEFLGKTLHYYTAGFEDRTDAEYLQIGQLQYELELLLSRSIPGQEKLLSVLGVILGSLHAGPPESTAFVSAHEEARHLAQALLFAERSSPLRLQTKGRARLTPGSTGLAALAG